MESRKIEITCVINPNKFVSCIKSQSLIEKIVLLNV